MLREHGITLRHQGLTDEQVREAVRLHLAGQSLSKLGAHFGVSHAAIANVLRRQGCPAATTPKGGVDPN
ncbi:helix-turn-helix domain-containing protein [Mycobacteroides abscessus]|uniref:helix-turn-helix domain-containing protein n=1 Tax=Mycobacteroides abscessus TaxID=36809 RepID=UPI0030EF1E17